MFYHDAPHKSGFKDLLSIYGLVHQTTLLNQKKLVPADVQSLPGVSRHRRHFPGTELNRRGVHDPVS